MWNPYWDEVKDCYEYGMVMAGWDERSMFVLHDRYKLVAKYSFAIPNEEAVDAIKALGLPVIEMAAGSGYWARVLSEAGVQVEAYDINPKDEHWNWTNQWYDVKVGDPTTLRGRKGYALLLVWPPYTSRMDKECFIKRNFQGDYLILVGEGEGGCTGSSAGHSYLSRWMEEVTSVSIPQWFGIHDHLVIYRRK